MKERLASEIARVISETLLYEARDEALFGITVLGAEIAGDGQVARIYYSAMGRWEEASRALERAKGFLRTRLAQEIRLRWVPRLIFVPDSPDGTWK